MEINQDEVVIDGKPVGTYDLYDVTGLAVALTADKSLQETLLTGASTLLEVLQNAADQRVISSFQIVHRP